MSDIDEASARETAGMIRDDVDTALIAGARAPLFPPISKPEDVARAVASVLQARAHQRYVPRYLGLFAVVQLLLPTWALHRIGLWTGVSRSLAGVAATPVPPKRLGKARVERLLTEQLSSDFALLLAGTAAIRLTDIACSRALILRIAKSKQERMQIRDRRRSAAHGASRSDAIRVRDSLHE